MFLRTWQHSSHETHRKRRLVTLTKQIFITHLALHRQDQTLMSPTTEHRREPHTRSDTYLNSDTAKAPTLRHHVLDFIRNIKWHRHKMPSRPLRPSPQCGGKRKLDTSERIQLAKPLEVAVPNLFVVNFRKRCNK